MVATPRELERTSRSLNLVGLMLGDIPELADEWDTLDEQERVSWSLEWHDIVVGHWRNLTRSYESDELLPDQVATYRKLRDEFEKLRPTLNLLDLTTPPA
jgi:hypothetical protein